MNPSSAIQQKKNFLQTKQRFRLLLNYNFTSCDYVVVLSYDNKHLPDNIGQAFEDAKNYLRRLNHWRCAHGLPKASYLYLVENRTREGKEARFHIHLVLSGDMPKAVVKQLWKKWTSRADRLSGDFRRLRRQWAGEVSSKNSQRRQRTPRQMELPAQRRSAVAGTDDIYGYDPPSDRVFRPQ